MPWYENLLAGLMPGAQLLLVVLGIPVLVFGLLKLLVLPLALWFQVQVTRRRRTGQGTLLNEWPTVSIIVPAYNEATVIENCVRSIQLTTYDRYEVVLVDDGSTDNTLELMHELAAGDPRITVLTQENAGKGAALNRGLNYSTGEVLMFVDADGIFSRSTVKRMLQGFTDRRVGAVCGDDRPVNLNRVQTRMLAFISHVGTGLVRRALTVIGCLPIVSGNIGAFPRSVLADVGPFREDTVGEDLELTWRVHRAGYNVVFAPKALVYAESPSTVHALWRQRVRWARGLLQTMRVHKDMIGNLRRGRFGAYLLFNTVTMVALPVLQLFLLLDLLLLVAGGRSPLGADAWAVLGWLGLVVTAVLTLFGLSLNRAWPDLRHAWTLPLVPFYSVFTGLTMAAALLQETRGKQAHWNKLKRTGVVSVPTAAAVTEVRV
ncbi:MULTISPECIES: glycosyltransferase family 2 protein [unclassified Arthrobacter]|uniref:glycosyltransferase n=1 Tax=unclassified Arthrobacter TaxID=235627 RepID=UPI00343046D6